MKTTARGTGGLCGETAAQSKIQADSSYGKGPQSADEQTQACRVLRTLMTGWTAKCSTQGMGRGLVRKGPASMLAVEAAHCTFHGGEVAAEQELEGENEGEREEGVAGVPLPVEGRGRRWHGARAPCHESVKQPKRTEGPPASMQSTTSTQEACITCFVSSHKSQYTLLAGYSCLSCCRLTLVLLCCCSCR